MRKIGCRYQGILYASLMNNNEPKLIGIMSDWRSRMSSYYDET